MQCEINLQALENSKAIPTEYNRMQNAFRVAEFASFIVEISIYRIFTFLCKKLNSIWFK